ncbi:MAG: NYN domain-containing protein [Planctomycetaceae bacterium]
MNPGRYELVIDGYNLMHATGHVGKSRGLRLFEREREQFLSWLDRHIPARLRPLTLVIFDAGETDNVAAQRASYRDLRVIFSPADMEADDLIEELIEIHSAPKRLRVVSSDHRLHKAARRRKANCVDSEQFLSMLAELARAEYQRRQQDEAEFKPTGEFPEQTAEWLEIFADVQRLADKEVLPRRERDRRRAAEDRRSAPKRDESAAAEPDQPPAGPARRRRRSAKSVQQPAEPAELSTKDHQPLMSPIDELSFWEARLRDLLQ